MKKQMKQFMKEFHMVQRGDHVLAGVSGGGDSMAMLHLLNELKEEIGFSLSALHIHHGLRGQEADRDAELVRDYCEEKHIRFAIKYFDVAKEARKRKFGTEETGRILRRKAFEYAAAELEKTGSCNGAVKIALAHHADDLAETMLHHMARGTGLKGLAGIRPVNGRYIRPLLICTREEIEEYVKENAIRYATDSTNLEDDYTRNRIRHHILKNLKDTVNAKTVEHFTELSLLAGEADEYFLEKAEEFLNQNSEACADGILIMSSLWKEKVLLQRYIIKLAIQKASGKEKDISAVHIKEVVQLKEKQAGKKVDLPYRLEAVREQRGILIHSSVTQSEGQTEAVICSPVQIPGSLEIDDNTFRFEKKDVKKQPISEKKYTKWIDYDRITMNLCVRTRKPGDFFILNEKNQKKMLNRFFIDEKIPAEARDKILLVADGSHIVWIVGYRLSQAYKISEDTRSIVEINYSGGIENGRKNQCNDQ